MVEKSMRGAMIPLDWKSKWGLWESKSYIVELHP